MATINVFTIWHNRAFAVGDSISSLLEQSFTDFKLIAVDDGSTDSTLQELLLMRSIAFSRGIDMEVLSQENSGFTKSLIWAIKEHSDSEFVAIHGAGDISLHRRLELQVAEAERSKAVLVGCWVEVINQEGKVEKTRRVPQQIRHNLNANAIGRPGTHGAALIRRSAYNSCGGYRREFEYAQDADLWLRIVNEGKGVNCQEVLYQKVRFNNSVSQSKRKQAFQRMYSSLAIEMADSTTKRAHEIYRDLGRKTIVEVFPVRRLLRRLMKAGFNYLPLATVILGEWLKFRFRQVVSFFQFRAPNRTEPPWVL